MEENKNNIIIGRSRFMRHLINVSAAISAESLALSIFKAKLPDGFEPKLSYCIHALEEIPTSVHLNLNESF